MSESFQRRLTRVLPIAVSALALAMLLRLVDLAAVGAALTLSAALWLAPALLVYGAVSLLLEGLSLGHLVPSAGGALPIGHAVRIKAATYLLGIVNYALGVGALALLLRRRAGVSIGDAAGVALSISALDLAILIGLASVGATLLGAESAQVRAGVVVSAGVGFVGGLILLRAPGSLGPLERIRELTVFRALRRIPLTRLAGLSGLRLLFVLSFVTLSAFALRAFGIVVPAGDLVVGIAAVTLVAALPIAVAGIGTSQFAFVFLFREHADEATLLAAHLVLSAGLIAMRVATGLAFAREYAREAREAAKADEAA